MDELGEDAGGVGAALVEQPRLPRAAGSDHAEAVVLELEDPAGTAERTIGGLRLHRPQGFRIDCGAGGAEPLELRADLALRTGSGFA